MALSRKDIPPLSDRPIRRLPTDGEGKKSATIAGRAKREKTKTRGERERERHLKRFEESPGRAIIEKGFCLSYLASDSTRLLRFISNFQFRIEFLRKMKFLNFEFLQNFFFFPYTFAERNHLEFSCESQYGWNRSKNMFLV